MLRKTVGKLLLSLLTFIVISSSVNGQANCFKVDLQAVSISPVSASIETGKTTQVEVIMRNNGPCPIPIGHATAQITISGDHVELVAPPAGFSDKCGQWSFLIATTTGNQFNLFFRNNAGVIPVGGTLCPFMFTVKGINSTKGPAVITLASSLSASATTADMDGNNQSAYTEIAVTGNSIKEIKAPEIQTGLTVIGNNCNAILDWKAAAENKVESFEVEYSADDKQFTKVDGVPARSNAGVSTYQAIHDQGNGRGYYRLKIIHKGGLFNYSKTVSVDTKCPVKKGF